MFRFVTAAALLCASVATVAPADARVCRNSHGRRFAFRLIRGATTLWQAKRRP